MRANIVDMSTSSERATLETFFSAQINDPSRFPLLPVASDPHPRADSIVLGVWEDGKVVAGLHAAPPIYDVAEMRMRGVPVESLTFALKNFIMLYSVAVAQTHRREGLAAQLLKTMEEKARMGGFATVYGVTSADTVAFYRANGFFVRNPKKGFQTRWGETEVVFPIEGDAQWFSKGLKSKNSTAAGSSWLAGLVNPRSEN